jgi:hypothetical protein
MAVPFVIEDHPHPKIQCYYQNHYHKMDRNPLSLLNARELLVVGKDLYAFKGKEGGIHKTFDLKKLYNTKLKLSYCMEDYLVELHYQIFSGSTKRIQ